MNDFLTCGSPSQLILDLSHSPCLSFLLASLVRLISLYLYLSIYLSIYIFLTKLTGTKYTQVIRMLGLTPPGEEDSLIERVQVAALSAVHSPRSLWHMHAYSQT